eukprot:m.19405 g.19405  ORF g.19405 m.19405 type:complete len:295 (+) comp3436_c0_seq2:136-1020(+)
MSCWRPWPGSPPCATAQVSVRACACRCLPPLMHSHALRTPALRPLFFPWIHGFHDSTIPRLHNCHFHILGSTPASRAAAESPESALLQWILRRKSHSLRAIPTAAELPPAVAQAALKGHLKPTHVFAISRSSASEEAFEQLKSAHGYEVAFHGTAFENVYSILHNGFCSHMNKTSLYGEGTYLSTDSRVCSNFMKAAHGWQRSQLGHLVSVIVVCEVVHHPDVKFPSREIPDKYIVVPNNDHLRPVYLFIYRDEPVRDRARPARMWMLYLFYALLLLAIGLYRAKWLQRLLGLR